MKKKIIIGIIIFIVVIVGLGIFTSYVDSGRVTTGVEPKFTIKTVNKDGSKITYIGLGYKVVRYVNVSVNEPYKDSKWIKMGSWFMKYDKPKDNEKISSLYDFYNTTFTKNEDIRSLSKNYSTSDAIKDNVFVIAHYDKYNIELYNDFMNKYQNKKNAFIRTGLTTIEGDLIIYDILYLNDKVYLVVDSTRDDFASDKGLLLKEYNQVSEYKVEKVTYWILHNAELTKENYDDEENFIITTFSR